MKLSKKFIYLSLLGAIVGCTPNSDIIKLKELQPIKIVDDIHPLSENPDKILVINDSTIGFVVYPNLFSIYNIRTGKNVYNYDSLNFNVDSIIEKTFQTFNKGKLTYLKHSVSDIQSKDGSFFLVNSFISYKNKYYLKIAIRTKATFDNINSFLFKQGYNKEKLDSLAKLYDVTKIVSNEILDYFVVLDSTYKTTMILPVYSKEIEENHFINWEKSFYIMDNRIYAPLTYSQLGVPYDSVSMKNIPIKYCFAASEIKDKKINDFSGDIKSDCIHPENYSLSAHLAVPASFCEFDNILYSSMGKEIINMKTKQPESIKLELKEKEYITKFKINNDYLFMVTSLSEKKKRLDMSMRTYGNTDSLSGKYLRIINVKTNHIAFEKQFNVSSVLGFVSDKLLMEFFRNGEYYYCKLYEIDYN